MHHHQCETSQCSDQSRQRRLYALPQLRCVSLGLKEEKGEDLPASSYIPLLSPLVSPPSFTRSSTVACSSPLFLFSSSNPCPGLRFKILARASRSLRICFVAVLRGWIFLRMGSVTCPKKNRWFSMVRERYTLGPDVRCQISRVGGEI